MSYAGTYGDVEMCEHGRYWRNCGQLPCGLSSAEKERWRRGETHLDNGAGWCIGCPLNEHGNCSVKVRDCPVRNTPEQLRMHRIEDAQAKVKAAEDRLHYISQRKDEAAIAVDDARRELRDASSTHSRR